ncbi:hypothetical protein [Chryseobacterium camelliae]|uniref:hypothetical protein n=1 Tax=Chryseobacterium camelliae TaxID=1265445 RepID=UPI002854CAD7|nr:hypothetical protein [Chryseobacterium camelliae]MDR6516763.1 hypothetical protein [Chryseobacterium camelliae]
MDLIIEYIKANKDFFTIFFSALISFIGFGSLIKAIVEYRLQGRQKRADYFDNLKNRLRTDEKLFNITKYLEEDSVELRKINYLDKYYFLGFFEQIAVGVNSKLIKKNVAHYFFGYFAIRCWESENFWYISDNEQIAKDEYYWNTFKTFVESMKKIESIKTNPNWIQKNYYKFNYNNIYKF